MSKSTDLDQAIKTVLIDGMDSDETTASARIAECRAEFHAAYGYMIERVGVVGAIAEWLPGLPSIISIPYSTYDILALARQTGGLAADATEKQEEKIIDNYYNFMAVKLNQLFTGYRVPKNWSVK